MIIKKAPIKGLLSFEAEREVIELSTLRRCISISYKGFDSLLTELLTFSFAIYNANVKVRKEAFKNRGCRKSNIYKHENSYLQYFIVGLTYLYISFSKYNQLILIR